MHRVAMPFKDSMIGRVPIFALPAFLIVDRYRKVPPFGRGTIRHFHTNASGMKKLAARDFEDLLQVCLLLSGRSELFIYQVCHTCF